MKFTSRINIGRQDALGRGAIDSHGLEGVKAVFYGHTFSTSVLCMIC